MANNILKKGKGVIRKIAIDSIHSVDAFAGKKNKRLFIDILKDVADEFVVIIAYCILDGSAHFIIKAEDEYAAEDYVTNVTARYGAEYDGGKGKYGYPLRNEYISQSISSSNLLDAIAYVHALSPTDIDRYEFNSYNYLIAGTAGATAVVVAECGGNLTKKDFLEWVESGSSKRYKKLKHGKEKVPDVLEDLKYRYLGGRITEERYIFIITELIERCSIKYKKAARIMGVKYKKSRDIMVATVLDLVERRGHPFYEAFALMRLKKENRMTMLLDCIVETNRRNRYSYDHIIHSFGIIDFYYDILVEIMRGLHRKYNFNFEELCLKFHLQNLIPSIRTRCEF